MSNQYPSKPEVAGNVKISENVIRSIAKETAMEIEGVEAIAPPHKSLLRAANAIEIAVSGDVVEITLNLVFQNGVRLQKAAEQVQRAVKENVQNMTGVVVSKVHIIAAGLVFEG